MLPMYYRTYHNPSYPCWSNRIAELKFCERESCQTKSKFPRSDIGWLFDTGAVNGLWLARETTDCELRLDERCPFVCSAGLSRANIER